MHSLVIDDHLNRKVSAPAWMKNPKRLSNLPLIEFKLSPKQQRLDSFTVSIEPLPRDRNKGTGCSRVSPKFFKD